MTYAKNSYIRWLITQHASQQTTRVSLYNLLSPQRSDCTMTPSSVPALICLINSLARTAGIGFIPWRTCRLTDIIIQISLGCQDTWYAHKLLSQAVPACPSGPRDNWSEGYSWHRGSLTLTQEQGRQLYLLIPSQNHKAKGRKRKPGVCKRIRAAQITHSQ